jgi:hypothetical protein
MAPPREGSDAREPYERLPRQIHRLRLIGLIALIVLPTCIHASPPRDASHGEAETDQTPPGRLLVALLNHPPELIRAQELVTARCMRRRGFQYPLPSRAPKTKGRVTLAGEPLAIPVARREGYGFSRGPQSDQTRFLRNLAPGRRAAARASLEPPGSPMTRVVINSFRATAARRGCVAEGRKRVYGSVRGFLLLWYGPQVARNAVEKYFTPAIRTPEVEDAASSYSRCMSAAGFETPTPRAAWRLARQRFGHGSTRVTSKERQMATADARCQKSSMIYETISRAMALAGRKVLAGYADRFETMRALMRSSISRAASILHGRGEEAGSSP